MTVAELIEQLRAMPQEMSVRATGDGEPVEVTTVEIYTEPLVWGGEQWIQSGEQWIQIS